MKTLKAFSLIEVLLVVLILAVLASIVIPRVAESTASAKQAQCDSNRANLISALERYALNNDGKFPNDNDDFKDDVLKDTTYFPHGKPKCPYDDDYDYDDALFTVAAHSH